MMQTKRPKLNQVSAMAPKKLNKISWHTTLTTLETTMTRSSYLQSQAMSHPQFHSPGLTPHPFLTNIPPILIPIINSLTNCTCCQLHTHISIHVLSYRFTVRKSRVLLPPTPPIPHSTLVTFLSVSSRDFQLNSSHLLNTSLRSHTPWSQLTDWKCIYYPYCTKQLLEVVPAMNVAMLKSD